MLSNSAYIEIVEGSRPCIPEYDSSHPDGSEILGALLRCDYAVRYRHPFAKHHSNAQKILPLSLGEIGEFLCDANRLNTIELQRIGFTKVGQSN